MHAQPGRGRNRGQESSHYFKVLLSYNKHNSLILAHQQTALKENRVQQ